VTGGIGSVQQVPVQGPAGGPGALGSDDLGDLAVGGSPPIVDAHGEQRDDTFPLGVVEEPQDVGIRVRDVGGSGAAVTAAGTGMV